MTADGIAFILIGAACAGYTFIMNTYKFKYQAARKTGQHLYLMSLTWGIGLSIISYSFARTIQYLSCLDCHTGQLFEKNLVQSVIHFTLWLAFTTSFFIWAQNKRTDKASALYDVFQKDDLSKTILTSMIEEKPLQITLDNRKAYVGYVLDTVEPLGDVSYLTILPMMSGYRDSETLELALSNDYFASAEDFEKAGKSSPEDFGIVIPRSKIVSCHIFNPDLHNTISHARIDNGEN